MTEPVIRVDRLSKRFNIRREKSLKERIVNARRSRDHAQEFWALRDVTFDVSAASTVGLVGHNGSGKSTLLKTIGGIISPTEGRVFRRGRLAALLELGAGFHPDLTGRENVYLNASILGLSKAETARLFDEIVAFSGIEAFVDTQVKFYSSGMYVRLAFAVAVHVDPEVLLVDEVLAVGDEPFQRKCLDRVRRFRKEGRTIVLVTHALDTVQELCDRAIVLEHGHVIADGIPGVALPVLREAFAAEEAAQTRTIIESSSKVTSVRIVDEAGRPLSRLLSGDPATFEIEIETDGSTPDLAVAMSFVTHNEIPVFSIDSGRLGTEIPDNEGPRTIRFHVDSVPLVDGQYFAGVTLTSGGTQLQRWDHAGSLVVVGAPESGGLVRLGVRVSTDVPV